MRNSGFPTDCITEDDKKRYLEKVNTEMKFTGDLELTLENVVDDPVMRSMTKASTYKVCHINRFNTCFKI